MDPTKRRCLLVLAAGIWLAVSCTPKETKALLQPAEALGTVLAEETTHLAGDKKRIAVISPDDTWGAVSTAQEIFTKILQRQGYTVLTAKAANLGNPMRRGRVGLKSEDFLQALQASTDAGAIVSFAGAPLSPPGAAIQAPPDHPPVLVVATSSLGNVAGVWSSPEQLAALLQSKVIQLAIVDADAAAAQSPPKAGDSHPEFSQHYRILRGP
jgi:hypothetical protein